MRTAQLYLSVTRNSYCFIQKLMAIADELSYTVIFSTAIVDKPAMLLRQKQFKSW